MCVACINMQGRLERFERPLANATFQIGLDLGFTYILVERDRCYMHDQYVVWRRISGGVNEGKRFNELDAAIMYAHLSQSERAL